VELKTVTSTTTSNTVLWIKQSTHKLKKMFQTKQNRYDTTLKLYIKNRLVKLKESIFLGLLLMIIWLGWMYWQNMQKY